MKKLIFFLLSGGLSVLSLQAEFTPIKLLEGVQPVYPDQLKTTGENGEAKIRATIDESGSVAEAVVVDATHPAFGEAAREAVKAWRFQPAEEDGKPVPQTVDIPIVFKLSFKDRINALAGYEVFVDIDELTDTVHTWKDVKKYFPLRGKASRFIPYPESLKGSGISEEITIQCVISPDGLILNPSILDLKHKELAVPALEHLVTLRFQRPKLDGKPIYLQQKVKLLASEDPDFGSK
jgi:TonB family protein